jgi:hypothetical protein
MDGSKMLFDTLYRLGSPFYHLNPKWNDARRPQT